jgi:serine/threonine protein kinase
MHLSPDDILQNRYVIVNLIARGGMGAVYQALDQRLGSMVALKQNTVNDARLREAFEIEACMLANLQHPSLPVVSDHFSEGEDKFLVMQFIAGDDMGMMLERGHDSFPPNDVLRWADQLLDALEYLHAQKPPIIHRDIKPRNLKLTSRGDIMLLDFGLARGSQKVYSPDGAGRNIRVLTPEYAPLEQIQGNENDPRSDIYALAATLYHLLTAKPPSDALTRAAAILSEQTDPLRPTNELNPQVPPAVAVILHQAMSHSVEQRFASASAMRTALRMVRSSVNIPANSNNSLVSSSGQTTVPQKPFSPSTTTTTPGTPRIVLASIAATTPILVVSKQEEGHFKTINEAIAHAFPGTRILVRPGLYHEGLVLNKRLEIVGDGPLSDIFLETTSSSCILMQTDYAMVRGLTLRGRSGLERKEFVTVDIPQGRLVVEECDISSDTLACIAIRGTKTSPVIWRCQIHDGKSVGILVSNHGHGIIEECEIFSNAGAGIEIKQIGNPFIRQCKIHHGERDGVYVNDKGAGVVEGCEIFGNARAGVSIQRDSNPFIRLSNIHDQINGYGVYVYDKGEGTVEGCNIFGNAKAGVGITQGGNPFIRRCRIHHEQQRGIFIFENGEGTIERCQILENADTGVTIGQGSKPFLRRCRIQNNGSYAVRVLPRGAGSVEDCDLTGNAQGAWDFAVNCKVHRSNNKE